MSKHMTSEGRQSGEEGVLATRPTKSCSKRSLGKGKKPQTTTKQNPSQRKKEFHTTQYQKVKGTH